VASTTGVFSVGMFQCLIILELTDILVISCIISLWMYALYITHTNYQQHQFFLGYNIDGTT